MLHWVILEHVYTHYVATYIKHFYLGAFANPAPIMWGDAHAAGATAPKSVLKKFHTIGGGHTKISVTPPLCTSHL